MTTFLRSQLAYFLAYVATGWLALQIAVPAGIAVPLFPPAGIALTALLIHGWRAIPGIFIAAAAVEILAAQQFGIGPAAPLIVTLIAFGSTAQAMLACWLYVRLIGRDNPLDSHESIIRFIGIVAPVACLLSATIATTALYLNGSLTQSTVLFSWLNWWAGDTLGILIMIPLLLVFLGEPAGDWRPRRAVVAIPMLAALVLLALTVHQVQEWESSRLHARFNRDAEHVASLIQKRLDDQLDQIIALERLATVHPGLTRDTWRTFLLPLLERYPGTQNFGWSPLIRDEERTAFEARIREHEHPEFAILGRNAAGKTYPAERKAEYLPILYVEPEASNRNVIGLDPLILDKTAAAARHTREIRQPVATESIRLVQEIGEQRGVVLYLAVFGGTPERQLGMISGVFRMDDAMNAALVKHDRKHIITCLIDPHTSQGIQRLYGPYGCEQPSGPVVASWSTPIEFAGRTWSLVLRATPAYQDEQRSLGSWLSLAIGLIATALLGAFLLQTSGRTRRVETLVAERTHQLASATQTLQQKQDELAQAQRIAHLGSWEADVGDERITCSDELLNLLHLTPATPVDEERLLACIHPDDRAALAHALAQSAAHAGDISLDCRLRPSDMQAGHTRTLHFRIESHAQPCGTLRVRGTAQDVTSARAAEAHIAFLAHYDQLTGLPNRTHWNERAHTELRSAARHNDRLAVLFLDLDHFKSVNDSLGHAIGDRLLSTVADRLSGSLRDSDFLARLGGDEFVVILPRLEDREAVTPVAQKLIEALRRPIEIDEHELNISTSIGIALYPEDGQDVSTLLKHADVAMYTAKAEGRNAYCYFAPEMDAQAVERLMLENALRRGLERGELFLHYQPQVNAEGKLVGAEALVRWQHPEYGLMPPTRFIPVAEESGLIHALGEWVLGEACRQQVSWAAQGLLLTMAVNISALQFRQNGFSDSVCRILEETGAAPDRLELELTESALMQPTHEVLARMQRLRSMGIRLALDDFGTGYSSLSYLKRLPISRLKIDRGFVMDLPDDAEDAAIAAATLSLARNLGMEVVAEGVENEAQRDFLIERGCPILQGYLYSKPISASDFEVWSRQR